MQGPVGAKRQELAKHSECPRQGEGPSTHDLESKAFTSHSLSMDEVNGLWISSGSQFDTGELDGHLRHAWHRRKQRPDSRVRYQTLSA